MFNSKTYLFAQYFHQTFLVVPSCFGTFDKILLFSFLCGEKVLKKVHSDKFHRSNIFIALKVVALVFEIEDKSLQF